MRAVMVVVAWVAMASAALAAVADRHVCTPAEAASILQAFTVDKVQSTSKCPKPSWLADVAARGGPRGECTTDRAHVMVFGGNKGYDCMGWARMYSTSWEPSLNVSAWRAALGAFYRPPKLASCGVCKGCKEEYPLPSSGQSLSREQPPRVDCVEALPINAQLITFARDSQVRGKAIEP
jgi:hypothetical protein